MNMSGPRTEPWGMLLRTGLESNFISPTKACWVIPVRKLANHEFDFPPTPIS